MKNLVKKSVFLMVTLLMFILLVSGSAFATDGEKFHICEESGHTYEYMLEAATLEQAGKFYSKCINCLALEEGSENAIAKIETVKLSTSKCTYNGKVRKPTVKVEDADGKTLVEGQDYDVVYPSEMKLPCKYEIIVNFKDNYAGEKILSFEIVPKATTGVKAKTQTEKTITLTWNATTGATGYRVYQYSPSKGKYVVKASVKDVTTYKVSGLKAGTTYKFKIKPYVKSEDGTVIWGSASGVCSAKTNVAYGVKMSAPSATLYIGATKNLKATPTPSGKSITWKSSDTSIAKVSSSGKVTALKKGSVTITAYFKYNGKTYKDTCKVTVKTPYVKLSETSASLMQGNTLSLKATTAPADMDVTWKSSNTSVATVSSSGKVTAKMEGSATITASFAYKGVVYKKSCKVEIIAQPTEFGDLTGNVTYFYNNYRGNVPDTGAMVILIPRYGNAFLNLTVDSYVDWFVRPKFKSWNEEYGIYGAEVDGTGKYYFSHIPAGEYTLFIISEETTDKRFFDNEESYKSRISMDLIGALSPDTAKTLAQAVGYNKYYAEDVTIYENYTSHVSVDFGITYI